MPPKLFSFTHFTKNVSANPLESHTFKTKDLKPFRFIHFQKKGGGLPLILSPANGKCQANASLLSKSRPVETGHLLSAANHESQITNHQSLRISCLTSTLIKTKDLKSFIINTYKKRGEGTPIFKEIRLCTVYGYIQCVSAALPEGAMPHPLWQN